MRNNRKERNAFHSPSYWQSYSDMMAAAASDLYSDYCNYPCNL